ncbi:MAG: hypothetical protein NZ933_06790 [Bacteroidia bacterium]|nr:hypothetical protein [Bacteroidia bacterium]
MAVLLYMLHAEYGSEKLRRWIYPFEDLSWEQNPSLSSPHEPTIPPAPESVPSPDYFPHQTTLLPTTQWSLLIPL